MDNEDKSGAAFQLPQQDSNPQSAADLVRKKVQSLYDSEPSFDSESSDLQHASQQRLNKHRQYIIDLTNSGKSLAEIQGAWHEYYAGLPDHEKHQVWQEFYNTHSQASRYQAAIKPAEQPHSHQPAVHHEAGRPKLKGREKSPGARSLSDLKKHVAGSLPKKRSIPKKKPLNSLVFGLACGAIVLIVLMFGFFNERFIAPLIQPSRSVTYTPLISTTAPTSKDPRIIIPKINVDIPVVYGVNTITEADVDAALEEGVVHYADTANPGENGNLVIVGHSSNNIFNKGKYKFAFVLLKRLDTGDVFYLDKNGKRYTYRVYKKEIVSPNDVSVLGPTDKPATATLITCDPPGTSLKRLVVIGEQIRPDPSKNSGRASSNNLAQQVKQVPGNAPSLWSRLFSWLSR